MSSLVTLGKVSDHVDAMNRSCFDQLIDVGSASFSSLEKKPNRT